jgi:hypothetical protein
MGEYRGKVGIKRKGEITEGRWEYRLQREGKNTEGGGNTDRRWEYSGRHVYKGRRECREKVGIPREGKNTEERGEYRDKFGIYREVGNLERRWE